MRVVLVPLRVAPRKPEENRRRRAAQVRAFRGLHPDLVLFPECTLTGYLWEEADLRRFAESFPGPTLAWMAQHARALQAYLGFGMITRNGDRFFNTAILLDPRGETVLVQPRLSEQPPFAPGKHLIPAQTLLGTVVFLTCGDLFHEEARRQVPPEVDGILVPMARAFAKKSPDPARWEAERAAYVEAVQSLGKPAFLVNLLEEGVAKPSFGGAMVVEGDGTVRAESPHGTDQILVVDI